MSSPVREEVVTRQIPVAHQRDASGIRKRRSERPESEPRLQVGVARRAPVDDGDPYADVPCTD